VVCPPFHKEQPIPFPKRFPREKENERVVKTPVIHSFRDFLEEHARVPAGAVNIANIRSRDASAD